MVKVISKHGGGRSLDVTALDVTSLGRLKHWIIIVL